MSLSRTHLLLGTLGVLLLANIWYFFFSGPWGLITINVEKKPLSAVMKDIKRQGGVEILTNLPADTPVTLHINKVTLPVAMEWLSAVTSPVEGGRETNWQMGYVIAPGKAEIADYVSKLTGSTEQRIEGWKRFNGGGRFAGAMTGPADAEPTDPRQDEWAVRPLEGKALHDYLAQASRLTDAIFVAPETFNPAIAKAPKSGLLADSVDRLASAANGRDQLFIFLMGPRPRPPGDATAANDDQRPAGPPGGDAGPQAAWQPDPEAMDQLREHAEKKIARLPAADQAAAKAQLDARAAFYKSLKDLSPEDRRKKMDEMRNDPEMANKMAEAQQARDAKRTPDQRVAKGQRYVSAKMAAKGK